MIVRSRHLCRHIPGQNAINRVLVCLACVIKSADHRRKQDAYPKLKVVFTWKANDHKLRTAKFTFHLDRIFHLPLIWGESRTPLRRRVGPDDMLLRGHKGINSSDNIGNCGHARVGCRLYDGMSSAQSPFSVGRKKATYFSSRSVNQRRMRVHTSSLPTASSTPCSILGLSLTSITTIPSGVCLRSTP